jgi:16S rRNA processing protein RimM
MLVENQRRIGRLVKLLGIEGEALLLGENNLPKKIEKTEWVFLLIDGNPVPFSVSSIILRTENSAIIKFTNINTAEEMQEFIGFDVLYEEAKKHRSKASPFSESVNGYKVIDLKQGTIGLVKSLLNYQDNYLLQVFHGNREVLIPYNENIVVEIDELKKIISINAPDGLLELNQ